VTTNITTLDLNFRGHAHSIASYLIRSGDAVALVESGPGSTQPALEDALAREGLTPRAVTHVLLTHIHLDHAGASGWLSQQGAHVYVHPAGAPHILNPEKLIASATRIYGDEMDSLWGKFLPVAEDHLHTPQDGEEIQIGNAKVTVFHTPGHAEHHCCYLLDDLCFTGDVGGVRIPGYPYMRAPMPPPELHFAKWRETIQRLRALKFNRIAPTHFGIFDDAEWHLTELQKDLDLVEQWLEKVMPQNPDIESLRAQFEVLMDEQIRAFNLSEEEIQAYKLANPLGMSADGMMRYWKKVRNA
jgi:glyoxylase-like metal-dependent hydrolase (beta-lactamase superfamily II)